MKLNGNTAFSAFSVKDVTAAKAFYGHTLGLRVTDEDMGLIALHVAGGNPILIYPKGEGQEPAAYTVLNFKVKNIDAAIDALVAKGLSFEHYDREGFKADPKGVLRGAAIGQGPNIAWFKDPSGNILSLIEDQGPIQV